MRVFNKFRSVIMRRCNKFRSPIMRRCNKFHCTILVLVVLLCYGLYPTGLFEYAIQIPFFFFKYPLDVNMRKVVHQIKHGKKPTVGAINPYNFNNIVGNSIKCKDKDIFAIFIVKSAVDHFEHRSGIRQTWGKEKQVHGKLLQTIFMIGKSEDTKLQHEIKKEHHRFHDLVQDNFIDNYWNNTYKIMMAFHWTARYCRNARFTIFVDDDFYISPHNLVTYLENLSARERHRHVITGYIWSVSVPLRHRWTKWYTPLWEYPYWFWPPFPAGGAFVLPTHTAVDISYAMQYTKFIRFDDVFVGIVAWKLGIAMQHNQHFHMRKMNYYKKIIASHGFQTNELLDMWNQHSAQETDLR